ncbi:MAG: FtsQ-type POTRA domain-containing protein [Clostridia bacterium]|nr:FtsQ-type POTRA domain-containing protein [Clostridia bacterium]
MKEAMGLGNSLAQPRSRKPRHKPNKVLKTVVLVNLFLIALIVAVGLLTPAFYIKEVTVTGTQHLTPAKVIDAANLQVGKNIFTFRKQTVEDSISSLSFIQNVNVIREYPDKVSIVISECSPMAQVLCGESLYIVIDETGKILDTTSESAKYGVPVIEGVFVEQFEVGNIISTRQTDSFEQLLLIAKELSENNMIDMVAKLSLEDSEIFLTFQSGIRCDIGNGNNSSYKIRFIREVISQLPAGKTGTVEFIDEYKAVFKEDE